MMLGRMVFGEIVGAVEFCFVPIDVILSLAHTIANAIEAHVDGFGSFLFHRSFANPSAVVLSVFRGVGGCGCPSSCRQIQIGHASLPL